MHFEYGSEARIAFKDKYFSYCADVLSKQSVNICDFIGPACAVLLFARMYS